MKTITSFGLVVALGLLSACGGGDSSGPSTGGPTPAPPPPPPPPPAATYVKFADLTGVQNFQTTCAGEESYSGQPVPLGGFPFGNTVAIQSDRSGPSYDITVANIGFAGERSLSFTPENLESSSTATSQRYSFVDGTGRTQRYSIFVPRVSDTDLEYTRLASLFSPSDTGFINLICALGVPTVLTDVPASSVNFVTSSTAAILRIVQNAGSGGGPTVQYSAVPTIAEGFGDPATGTVRFSIDLKGYEFVGGMRSDVVTDIGRYTGETTIDGSETNFSGLVVNAENVVVGEFGGWYFGPQGRTMAVSYTVTDRRPDDSEVFSAGVLLLRR
ncbi:hypothetical protein [Qipengyuania sphaerica]|uniref:hypothetical protein n=1 Tax=Qipengyuania sphaerica TaxID=2867243 RepID=UPI001C88AD7A|nr:hypothetical protein [Qipengyuania sphaerica]MBX7540242.1 hypothetical protein [Qipengyuania sphaerica]